MDEKEPHGIHCSHIETSEPIVCLHDTISMKRALAERAKHTSFEKTTTAVSSPPHKAPRLESPVEDESSAFYLKHQNRALATELQSLKYSVTLLEQERDTRRSQCRTAAQMLLSWQTNLAPEASRISTPASTGSGDSVEWTSLLASAIQALTKQQQQNDTSTCNDDTPVAELQGQIAELVASRTELHQRERKLRRNVYRMSAGMLTPEQVVESLDKDDDELEASIRLEKAQQKPENGIADVLLKTEDTTAATEATVDSAIVKELESKIEVLEATVRRSEDSIQKVRKIDHRNLSLSHDMYYIFSSMRL